MAFRAYERHGTEGSGLSSDVIINHWSPLHCSFISHEIKNLVHVIHFYTKKRELFR